MLKRKVICLFWHQEKHTSQITEDVAISRFKYGGSESESKAMLNTDLPQVYFPSSRLERSVILKYPRKT